MDVPISGSLEASFDWFSATLPAGHRQSGATYHAAFDLLEQLSLAGNKVAETSKLGYRGVQCGKLFVGESVQGLIIIATGSAAPLAFNHLYIEDMHVSRLDIQCTMWEPQDGEATGVLAEQNARDFKKRGSRGSKRQIRHISDDEGGYTLYVGSRKSTSFLRLYNKGAETKEAYYEGAWRYEVEMHNQLSTQTARLLAAKLHEQEASIAATVSAYYRARGIYCPWRVDQALDVLRPLPTDEPDDIRSLRWLTDQVRPTVQRLIHAGYAADVAEALGLGRD